MYINSAKSHLVSLYVYIRIFKVQLTQSSLVNLEGGRREEGRCNVKCYHLVSQFSLKTSKYLTLDLLLV